MKMNKILIALAICVLLAGCTDAERASLTAYGENASIKCYSGGQIIHDDISTGKVVQIDGDGITYQSKNTKQYVRAYADCIVTTL
jgi:uncharacterized protein YceK